MKQNFNYKQLDAKIGRVIINFIKKIDEIKEIAKFWIEITLAPDESFSPPNSPANIQEE